MRPERLEIKNFLGIRNANIDFKGKGLFAILGDNGAGKSSILEAIYFALFGETLRFGNRKKQAINRHSTEPAQVILEFSHGNRKYIIIRSISQSSQPSIVRMEKKDPKEIYTKDANEKIREIINVDKSTFLNTILLPQGEITKFISSTRAETVKNILNSMFNIQVIDEVKNTVSKRHSEIKGRYEEKLQVKRRLHTYDGKDLETAIKDIEDGLRKVLKNIEINMERLGRVNDSKDKYNLLFKEKENLLKAKNEKENIEKKLKEIIAFLKEDEDIEAAKHIKPYEQIYIQNKNAVERIKEEVENNRIELKQIEAELPLLRENLSKETQNLKFYREQSEELKEEVKELESAVKSANDMLRLKEIERKLNKLKEEIEKYRNYEPLYKKMEELIKDKENIERELQKINNTLEEKQAKERKIRENISSLEEKKKKFGISEIELLSARLSEKLKVGESCPICGNEIKELKSVDVSGINVKMILDLEEKLSKENDNLKEILANINTFKSRKKEIELSIQTMEKNLKEISDIIGRKVDETNISEKLTQLQREFNRLYGEKDAIQKNLNGKSIELDVKLLQERFEKKRMELQQTDKQYEKLIRSTSELETRIEEKEKRKAAIIKSLEKMRENLERVENEMLKAKKMFYEKLKEFNMTEETYNLCKDRKSKGIKKQVEEFKKNIEKYEEEIKQIYERIKDIKEAELPLEEIKMRLKSAEKDTETLKNTLNELYTRKGSLKEKREELKRQKEELKSIEEELKKIFEEYEILKKLNTYLNKDRFPAYLSDYYLNIIVKRANAFLTRFLGGKYMLTTENSQLRIIDQNIPSVGIPISSLSGGEKVLVSLSITMAITELTTKHIDMLFIDEGFSPLDNNNIQEVANQIQMLEDTNKLIGIVTHNQDFAAHFKNILKVENGGARWIQTNL